MQSSNSVCLSVPLDLDPIVLTPSGSAELLLGETLTVSCNALSSQETRVVWMKVKQANHKVPKLTLQAKEHQLIGFSLSQSGNNHNLEIIKKTNLIWKCMQDLFLINCTSRTVQKALPSTHPHSLLASVSGTPGWSGDGPGQHPHAGQCQFRLRRRIYLQGYCASSARAAQEQLCQSQCPG